MFFRAAKRLPFADIDALTGGGGIVIVAPHPDDESLGCGGLIAKARAHDIAVRVVIVSDGVGSHPNSAHYPADRLRTIRQAEARSAVKALGLDDDGVVFLDLPDRNVPSSGPMADRAVRAIEAAASACGAGAILATWRNDPHCDHRAAAALAAAAAKVHPRLKLWSYPVWGWMLPEAENVGDAPIGFRLDIADYIPAKQRAISAHRSQTTDLIDDDPEGFRLTPEFIAQFLRPYEIYLKTVP